MGSNNIDLCPVCRQILDSFLDKFNPKDTSEGIYIEVNTKAPPPSGHKIVPICDQCRYIIIQGVGQIDGFTVIIP